MRNVSLPGAMAVATADGVTEFGALLTGLEPPRPVAAGAVPAAGDLLAPLSCSHAQVRTSREEQVGRAARCWANDHRLLGVTITAGESMAFW
jgi:hypothetical protein